MHCCEDAMSPKNSKIHHHEACCNHGGFEHHRAARSRRVEQCSCSQTLSHCQHRHFNNSVHGNRTGLTTTAQALLAQQMFAPGSGAQESQLLESSGSRFSQYPSEALPKLRQKLSCQGVASPSNFECSPSRHPYHQPLAHLVLLADSVTRSSEISENQTPRTAL